MIKIRVPATTSNIGPGFDCLGLALDVYNEFEVEQAEQDELLDVEERFRNPDNLFLKAYHKAGISFGITDHIRVKFACSIPVSRGLGSSASLSVGGLAAFHILHPGLLDRQSILNLCTELEGHPDNAAPALFGGLQAASAGDPVIFAGLDLDPEWIYTLYIPDFEVSTEKARSILPLTYPRGTAAVNGAHAVLTVKALAEGNEALLRQAATDQIHEPYRSTLIPRFNEIRDLVRNDTGGVFLISGSGSTCLSIAKKHLSEEVQDTIRHYDEKWHIMEALPAYSGTEYYKEETWHPIF